MSSTSIQSPGEIGSTMARLLRDEGSLRDLATRSGVSRVTLRQIAATGQIHSYVTAMALERATAGQIQADKVATSRTRGADLYQREPARSLLMLSFDKGVSVARLLSDFGLEAGDLSIFMNAPAGRYGKTKRAVKAALEQLSLPTEREEPR